MRKRGGKGKSDEMKEIKMEMNRAVEILTTQVFPSQVALIASSEICFYPVKIPLSQLHGHIFMNSTRHWGEVFFFFIFIFLLLI